MLVGDNGEGMSTNAADVLLITATDVESRAVLSVFKKATTREAKTQPSDDGLYFNVGEVHGTRVFMALSGMGTGGLGGSQEAVRKAIEALSPAAVIMVGIAFGINEQKQAIGDVLVSERLMLYDLQRVGTDTSGEAKLIARGDRAYASPPLIERFRVTNLRRKVSEPAMRLGLLLSGDKLADNIDFRQQLLDLEPEAIGGEMEGAGLYVACQNAKVDWILVKAICDWADGNKSLDKAQRQELAARNAATFVLEALQQSPLKRKREVATAEATRSVYSSLPSQPYFFGRDDELAVIADAIAPEARTWGALIDGPGGIGKTAVAVRAAHLAPTADFTHKIFLSAKVRELTPAGEQPLEDFMVPNYLALLTELGRDLGNETVGQLDPTARVAAIRHALTQVRALIVIDNVETFAESERIRLYQFLSRLPQTSKAIVTSRRRADIDARVIRLDRLDRDSAFALLDELAKNNRYLQKATERERSDLYELSNGNPLIIKWVAGQLGRGQSRTLSEACEFLTNAPSQEGNDPLEYVFGDLLETFTESETAVLSALAHFTQPATVSWIADIAGLSESAALTALEDLTDRALLVSDSEAFVFLLPRLTVAFLREKRPEAIIRAGMKLSDRAFALVMENGWYKYDRHPTLEHHWPVIAAALPLVYGDNARLQHMCTALRPFWFNSGRWDERLSQDRKAEEIAMSTGDFLAAGQRAIDVGWIHQARSEAEEVLACVARADIQWKQAPDAGTTQKAQIARLRGLGFMLKQQYDLAARACQDALELYQTVSPEPSVVSSVLNDLANIERQRGNDAVAEQNYRESLRIAKKNDELSDIAIANVNLAVLALDRKEWSLAEQLAREALDLGEKIARQNVIGSACRHLAMALARQGRVDRGLPYARRAVEVEMKLNRARQLVEAQEVLRECEQ